jgi:tRNA threonylcarbamoyladenosine biosynthesis protein TsaE
MENPDSFSITVSSADQTKAAGAQLASLLRPNDVVLLTGELGAGKTQFAQGVATGLGITEAVTSPTFNLIYEYQGSIDGAPGLKLYHFDLYRLEDSEQLDDIDYWALIEAGAVSLVEWGNRFADALPEDYLLVDIAVLSDTERRLDCSAQGRRSEAVLAKWQKISGKK